MINDASLTASVPEWFAAVSPITAMPGDSFPAGEPIVDAGTIRLHGRATGVELERSAHMPHLVVLFEGYLFESAAIARDLRLPDDASNVRIATAAYSRWKDRCFEMLDGHFLLVVYDESGQCCVFGHDSMGQHPLYYAMNRGMLGVASNVLALARSGIVEVRPNRLAVGLHLMLSRPAPAETFFEGISRLAPGRTATLDRGGRLSIRQYWLPVPADDEPWIAADDIAPAFEEALVRSVSNHMRQGQDGIMLSGGLDSVTITALAVEAARASGMPDLVAVSSRNHPDDGSSYEEEMQDLVVARLGLRHITSDIRDWLGTRDIVSASLEEIPGLNAPSLAYWVGAYMGHYKFVASTGTTRLLTGSGGDEWLSVHPVYAADLLRTLSMVALARFVSADAHGGGAGVFRALRYLGWTYGLKVLAKSAVAQWVPSWHRMVRERHLAELVPDRRFEDPGMAAAIRQVFAGRPVAELDDRGGRPRSFYRRYLRGVWDDSFLIHERECAFHSTRVAGLRLMSPYHDRRLLELLCRVPPERLFEGSGYKGMARLIAERRLPGLGLDRQRKTYPEGELFAVRALREHLGAALGQRPPDRLRDLGLLRPDSPTGTAEDFVKSPFRRLVEVFAELSAETWLEAHF